MHAAQEVEDAASNSKSNSTNHSTVILILIVIVVIIVAITASADEELTWLSGGTCSRPTTETVCLDYFMKALIEARGPRI